MRKFSTGLVWHMPPVDYALTAGYLQAGPEHRVDVTDWAVESESKTDRTKHAYEQYHEGRYALHRRWMLPLTSLHFCITSTLKAQNEKERNARNDPVHDACS